MLQTFKVLFDARQIRDNYSIDSVQELYEELGKKKFVNAAYKAAANYLQGRYGLDGEENYFEDCERVAMDCCIVGAEHPIQVIHEAKVWNHAIYHALADVLGQLDAVRAELCMADRPLLDLFMHFENGGKSNSIPCWNSYLRDLDTAINGCRDVIKPYASCQIVLDYDENSMTFYPKVKVSEDVLKDIMKNPENWIIIEMQYC